MNDTHYLWVNFDDRGLSAILVQAANMLARWMHRRDAPPKFDDGGDMVDEDALW